MDRVLVLFTTVLVLTPLCYRTTTLAPYGKPKFRDSGGSIVARAKLNWHHQEWSLWLKLTGKCTRSATSAHCETSPLYSYIGMYVQQHFFTLLFVAYLTLRIFALQWCQCTHMNCFLSWCEMHRIWIVFFLGAKCIAYEWFSFLVRNVSHVNCFLCTLIWVVWHTVRSLRSLRSHSSEVSKFVTA